ncbi:hypothetical protein TRFO_32778 [Tritrichomonas foetus]|uniref:DUF3447 domain-containing protein n=1 Tax=Tritrichomonas foetus TaxID=1144522 RepID=A0A1J4JQ07_9EUKA|nr:hypothetical protein TRFO_32778 [Tritrichomonas foetus]|eukprot:OHT00504.1 hypothetical protein TRFO_32778 [Tritrichomonas foetus]
MIKHEKFRYHDSNIFDIHEEILLRACYIGFYNLYQKMINLLGYERLNCKNKNLKDNMRNIFSDACYGGNVDILRDLLQNADIDVNFSLDAEPPVFRAFNYKLWVVLEHPKIDINIKSSNGNSILHLIRYTHKLFDIQRLIEIPNIDINAQNNDVLINFFWRYDSS